MQQGWKIKDEEPQPDNFNKWKRPPFVLMVLGVWIVIGLSICFIEANKQFHLGIPKYGLYAFSFFLITILCGWISGIFSKKLNKKEQRRELEIIAVSVSSIIWVLIVYSLLPKTKYVQLLGYAVFLPVFFLLNLHWKKQDKENELKGDIENE